MGRRSPGDMILGGEDTPDVRGRLPESVVVVVAVVDAVVVLADLVLALLMMRLERWRRGEVAGREVTTPPTVSVPPDSPTKRSTPMACTCSTRLTRGPVGDWGAEGSFL